MSYLKNSTSTQEKERIHSMDSLRATMMILGIILHSAVIYSPLTTQEIGDTLTLRDPISSNVFNGFIVAFIHSFRLQIFFLVAGFFAALLYYKRSPGKMIKNRILRILFPFLVFETFLGPILSYTEQFSILTLNYVENKLAFSFSGLHIGHFWFLYYLIIITVLVTGMVYLLKIFSPLSKLMTNLFSKIFSIPLMRIVSFSCFTGLTYITMICMIEIMPEKIANFFMPEPFPSEPRIRLIPNPISIIYYSSFYIFGWFLFKSKEQLNSLKKYDWLSFIIGLGLFIIFFNFEKSMTFIQFLILKSIMTWFLIFGIMGIFIRYFSDFSPIWKYVSDSSYWVYLVHMQFCYLIPCLIFNWKIGSILKVLIVISLTGLLCIVSYHYLVRNTIIGKFLNGRKYPIQKNKNNLIKYRLFKK
tara:strand:- start:607 stop:1851 length:1245 start_codon:yes stop_codon:yes gene_type:complete